LVYNKFISIINTTIKIGGVPEHFNLPIQLGIQSGAFADANIDLQWVDFPGGTGAMTQALRTGECDVCVLLTEGIITDIINGNPSKIISGYVQSPLTWGIHTATDSKIQSHDEVFEQKIAISRHGSGSHLMPTVDALMKGEKIAKDQFVTVQNIDGALKSLGEKETNIFYWEKYTTKPFVKKGHLRRIGEFLSPWPCFMIAARDEIIDSNPTVLDKMLRIIHEACEAFMENNEAPKLVSKTYDIPLKDAEYWFHSTEWTTNSWVSNKMLNSVLFTLKAAGIVDETASVDGLVWERP